MENDLSRKIKQLRLENNMTLEQVAQIVGVGKSTVRKWENGIIANMRRDKIAVLAKALHTTPAFLMGWEDEYATKKAPDRLELTEAESMLLELFRQIPRDQQRVFLDMGRVYANSLKKD